MKLYKETKLIAILRMAYRTIYILRRKLYIIQPDVHKKGLTLRLAKIDSTLFTLHIVDNVALEAFLYGLMSLLLTLINIVCIIITGILILKLKEVTPDRIPQPFSNFWKRHLKNNRKTNKKKFAWSKKNMHH